MTARLGLPRLALSLCALPLTGLPLRSAPTAVAPDQVPKPKTLADLSLEELGNLEITSVSKRPEKLSEAAAAVFVLTREDIRRSGARSVAEALRLAPNLDVARVDAFTWAITARGFNSHNGNKLLVLIDGRTVYSPFFSGVWWDAQNVVLQDVERIEVISGPGGTLWGSNAVNGVINILTRSAKATEGGFVEALAGKGPVGATARYGFKVPGEGDFRVYAKAESQKDWQLPNGRPAMDGWHTVQTGLRGDWDRGDNRITVQGDAYANRLARTPNGPGIADGGNLLGRWEHAWSSENVFQAQVYFDRVRRDIPKILAVRTDTLDVDVQHRFRLGARNELVWGFGYRTMEVWVRNGPTIAVHPDHQTLGLSNLFVQDTLALVPDRVDLTLGAKVEHNAFTGTETQPNLRLSWKPAEGQLLWTSVSRAVRTPALLDRDYFLPGQAPYLLAGGPHFVSEQVKAYEAGYRLQTASGFSCSFTPFYNTYTHIRSIEPNPVPSQGLLVIANEIEGDAWGAELWADIPLTSTWRLKPAYTYHRQDLRLTPQSRDPFGVAAEGNDPRHRILLTSLWSFTSSLELDGTLRHVSGLPNPKIPAYTTLDVHFGWKPRPGLEVALLGENLFSKVHPEFTMTGLVQRQGALRVSWAF